MNGEHARARVDGHDLLTVDGGWEVAATEPGAALGPEDLDGLDLGWLAARVPGTVAGALRDAGRWGPGDDRDLDAADWWFRTSVAVPAIEHDEEVVLRFDGVATVFEVFLDGQPIVSGQSMFEPHEVAVGPWADGHEHELSICCRALAPLVAQRRTPRQRWRQSVVDGGLRFHRTMLLGRAPGFAAGPPAIGPWRPVVLERRRRLVVEECRLRPRLDGQDGVLEVRVALRTLGARTVTEITAVVAGPDGARSVNLAHDAGVWRGELRLPHVERWYPHTHGEPVLHPVKLVVGLDGANGPLAIDGNRVGFRTLSAGSGATHDILEDGLDLHLNGVRVFARGALWTPPDFVDLTSEPRVLRAAIEQVRDAGMNMLRLPGTGAYESSLFHDLCDEMGILVWQDLMFANMDYPIADVGFREIVARELQTQLGELAGRPSLAVVCGNSEIEQQVGMLGLDPQLGRGELFGQLIPAAMEAAGAAVPYVPSAPCGGALPFRTDHGVANYFGVGGYRRSLRDPREARVRFAAECLAFSNVADAGLSPDDPRWKAGVPSDAGTDWDFEDVRDHYLQLCYGVEPDTLRHDDPDRYLELSRAVTGEVMADVLGEWRRAGSPCGGALILWLHDLRPGAGWGLVDSTGRPKVAWHHVRRALAPVAVWMTDEGLNGIAVHVANDRPTPLRAQLRVALYREAELLAGSAEELVELGPHDALDRDLEGMIGRFADVTWAYRFGPPQQDVVVASLERDGALLSQAVRFPVGPPMQPLSAGELGIVIDVRTTRDGASSVVVGSRRALWGVRLALEGFTGSDDAFAVEPGRERTIELRPTGSPGEPVAGALTALNLAGQAHIGPTA